ncbi:hypothetical protein EC396_12280 [Lutibacter sp. HS1-25]|uniref:hypothetical protein n=1 Tax=Lutibacter sp. HS1-25 TaxID=2485000 RepID=UPI001011B2C3|nr:hypothetical protein [Lutibacter sp. HS1-25]RXP47716.1 hypothetical protein EC396_12925 [Lutibacter sp. HS1-25]RXP50969.1 hypothetical protein EC396_12280 [Lutibacter sp. HS1-25]
MRKSKTSKWIFISIGGIVVVLISFTLIYSLLIPDACYYHTHEMNSLMSFFYSAGPASNGHPEPNILNLILSLSIGGVIGYRIYENIDKEN